MALLDFTGTGGYRSFDFDQCRDKRDWQIMLRHLKADWMPPILQRRKV